MNILEFFESFILLREDELTYLKSKIYSFELKKDNFLIREGGISDCVVWIKEGIIH